jgi:PRC-barrel domain
MSFKTGASAAALALTLGLTAAAAQQPQQQQQVPPPAVQPETPRKPVADQIVTQPEGTILTRDLIGHTVTAPDNTKIGTISDLLLSRDGRTVEGFVMGVGGFLGIGERNVALKMDQLKITPKAEGGLNLVSDLKTEELSNAPAFKSHRDIEAEKRAAERPVRPPTGTGTGGGQPER